MEFENEGQGLLQGGFLIGCVLGLAITIIAVILIVVVFIALAA